MTDDSNLSILARNVKEARRFRRLSQARLAALCNLSPKTIYLIEKGKHSPNVATLEALGKALGIDPRALLAETNEVSTTTRWLADVRKLISGTSASVRQAAAALVRNLTNETTSRTKS